ncbi:MAG TPA: M20/M25/M40 family metallo-hydrolase [Thermoguttaceae bacterium]|nr:M20/M25/M40 family metallo-hydrolase [Thermoguttaceae bacterium]
MSLFRTIATLGLIVVFTPFAQADEEAAAIEKRLADSARYLASDELGGRGMGTDGLALAADYIAEQFEQAGLETELFDGTAMQKFRVATSAEVGPGNVLKLIGPSAGDDQEPQTIELDAAEAFSPLAVSGTGSFDLSLVFVGYGITAKEEEYDDYADVDVEGKAVVMLCHEPQQSDADSPFNGKKNSPYASLERKVATAKQHGAAAVVLCNDRHELFKKIEPARQKWQQTLDWLAAEHEKFKQVESPTLEQVEAQRQRIEELTGYLEKSSESLALRIDPIVPFDSAGQGRTPLDFPVVFCRREALDKVLRSAANIDLEELERQIDEGPTPHSQPLPDWHVAGTVDIQREQVDVRNVVALLPGKGPMADEIIVVGAHYDHVGIARERAKDKDTQEEVVHNGADDNASGTAVMLEIARSLANRPEKLGRSIVFIAFTCEETGLLGSRHYIEHPLLPLDKTIVMLNLDMVGRLRDNKLTATRIESAAEFSDLLDRSNCRIGLDVVKKKGSAGASDQISFRSKNIPAMHFYTGTHEDYHRPGDDFEKLNISGMRRIGNLVEKMIIALANAEDRPQFIESPSK